MIRDVNDQCVEGAILWLGSRLVAVAIHAYGSTPCEHFMPELEAVAGAEQFSGRISFYRLDGIENPTLAKVLGVRHIPTLLVFKDRAEIARYEGPYSRETMMDRLTRLLAGSQSLG